MTSMLRQFAQTKQALTLFVKPETPAYSQSGRETLFPFSYSNGVLDISYSGNTFKTTMVDVTGQAPGDETDTTIRITSGPFLVNSLGPNFKDYIRAWRSATIDANSPITINIAPQVLRVQEGAFANVDSSSASSFKISDEAPASDDYITGSIANNYEAKYIFKTPLTFTTVEGGVIKYITFRTQLDQE